MRNKVILVLAIALVLLNTLDIITTKILIKNDINGELNPIVRKLSQFGNWFWAYKFVLILSITTMFYLYSLYKDGFYKTARNTLIFLNVSMGIVQIVNLSQLKVFM